jgi:hypothetical protein
MAHYARVVNNLVEQVIVAEEDVIQSGAFGDPAQWIQTSYNTKGGVHSEGGVALRKNFAFIGCTYEPLRDVFIPPRPYLSWILDEETCLWSAPIPAPQDGNFYNWNEAGQRWEQVLINTIQE